MSRHDRFEEGSEETSDEDDEDEYLGCTDLFLQMMEEAEWLVDEKIKNEYIFPSKMLVMWFCIMLHVHQVL